MNIYKDRVKNKEVVESTKKCLAAMQTGTGFFFFFSNFLLGFLRLNCSDKYTQHQWEQKQLITATLLVIFHCYDQEHLTHMLVSVLPKGAQA